MWSLICPLLFVGKWYMIHVLFCLLWSYSLLYIALLSPFFFLKFFGFLVVNGACLGRMGLESFSNTAITTSIGLFEIWWTREVIFWSFFMKSYVTPQFMSWFWRRKFWIFSTVCLFLSVEHASVFIAYLLLVLCRIDKMYSLFYCFFCWEENYLYLSFENNWLTMTRCRLVPRFPSPRYNWLTTTRCRLVPHFPSPKSRDLASLYIMGLTIFLITHIDWHAFEPLPYRQPSHGVV